MQTTTVAFVRSLVNWQWAMSCAVAGPSPTALMADVDLVAASVDRAVALEWVAFLETVARCTKEMIAEAESRDPEDKTGWIGNQRTLVEAVRIARKYALEHVASFTETPIKSSDRE